MKFLKLGLITSLFSLGLFSIIGSPQIEALAVESNTVSVDANFDENNIAFTFGALSDVHIGYGDNNLLFHQALSHYEKNYDVDAMFFTGDLTQVGIYSEATEFINIYEEHYNPAEVPLIACYGNHDTYWTGSMDTEGFYNAFSNANSDLYNFDKGSLDAIKAGNRWVQLEDESGKVYNFVTAELVKYGSATEMTNDTITWLKETLTTITTEYPNDYVYFGIHSPAANTVAGSWSQSNSIPGSLQYEDIFKEFPQVVLFSGHTHDPVQDDLAINQGTYTQVHIGAMSDLDTPMVTLVDRHDYSTGDVVEIDKNGAVRITRIDFVKKLQIQDSWELLPFGSEGYLDTYNFENRKEANQNPYFEEDATMSVEMLSEKEMKLTFDRAKDDMMVFTYDYVVKNEAGESIGYKLYHETGRNSYNSPEYYNGYIDDFFDWPDLSLRPDEKTVILKLDSSLTYPYSITITAYDAFGSYTYYKSENGSSEPLTVNFVDKTLENNLNKANFEEAIFELGEAEDLTIDDLETIKSLRSTYEAFDSVTKEEIRGVYRLFAELEKYFYNNVYTTELVNKEVSVDDIESYLSASHKGSYEESENGGVTLKWNSAPKNSLIGTNKRYELENLTIDFKNLSYTSNGNRTFAVVLSEVRADKWTDNECALFWFDMENGNLYYGENIYLGNSKYFTADNIGYSAFTFKFAVTDTMGISLTVETIHGTETFELSSSFVSEMTNLKDLAKVYAYVTPWSSRQSMQVDMVSIGR